jgi:hypothetical protein
VQKSVLGLILKVWRLFARVNNNNDAYDYCLYTYRSYGDPSDFLFKSSIIYLQFQFKGVEIVGISI